MPRISLKKCLSNQADLKSVIEGLIAYGFFDRSKLIGVMAETVKNGQLKQDVLEYYRDII